MLKTSLRYFLRVAQCGSIRAASEELNVAQSAISRQIQALERELAVELLVRTSKGISLTEQGKLISASMNDVVQDRAGLDSDLMSLRQLKRGHVRIAAIESMLPSVLPHALDRYLADFPDISFSISMDSTPLVLEKVRDGHVDIGVVFCPPSTANLSCVYRSHEPLLAVMRPDHELAKKKGRISVAEIAKYPVALPAAQSAIRDIIDNVCLSVDVKLRPTIETNSLELLHRFASSGDGIAVLLRHTVQTSVARNSVLPRRFKETAMEGYLEVVTLKHRKLPPACATMVSVLRKVIDAVPAP